MLKAFWRETNKDGDRIKTYVAITKNGAYAVEQLILTTPNHNYFQYRTLKTFGDKVLIGKVELHTEETWKRIVTTIKLLKEAKQSS